MMSCLNDMPQFYCIVRSLPSPVLSRGCWYEAPARRHEG